MIAVTRVFLLSMLLAVFPARAQNGYSFDDAARSAIDYRVAAASPQRQCGLHLARALERDITLLSATAVPASDAAPAHCRVLGVIAPEVRFEVALPQAWNRRLYMRGNGGYAGEDLDAPARIAQRNAALRHGFIAAQTNTGHDARSEPLGTFAVSVQKTLDYSFRAVHETAVAAKKLARAYYQRPAAFSYFDGCSTGGRQGLMSAQRYPGDFDGIVVGAPVLNFTDTMIWFAWTSQAFARAPIPETKMRLVAEKVYAECDAKDGAADGLIEDPRACRFDPAADLPRCETNRDGPGCFTAGEIGTLQAIYGGARSQGRPYHFPQPVGAEKEGTAAAGHAVPVNGWVDWLIAKGNRPRHVDYGESFMRYLAFQPAAANPAFDLGKFDFDKDPSRMQSIRGMLDATNPDLSAFRSRGGKIVMYHGWADTALTPLMSTDYYEKVQRATGAATPDFMRLFMVPGMFHCRGGVGVDRIDALTPLVNWVEGGTAPSQIVAGRVEAGKVVRTRPLCPYPEVARHDGAGSLDRAESFACRKP